MVLVPPPQSSRRGAALDERVFTANAPQWKPKEARKPHDSSQKRYVQTGTPTLQGPSTAPAGPILLKFWLKTRKSIQNKVTKFQIPTPNGFGARIEKPPGGGAEYAPARNMVKSVEFSVLGTLGWDPAPSCPPPP